jgi:uncharacterized membrane protein YfcA
MGEGDRLAVFIGRFLFPMIIGACIGYALLCALPSTILWPLFVVAIGARAVYCFFIEKLD